MPVKAWESGDLLLGEEDGADSAALALPLLLLDGWRKLLIVDEVTGRVLLGLE